MEIIQVVGYKNSGKTTISSHIITHFTKIGKRVASVKHHGHGGVPEGLQNTDSEKHKQAGALLAGVEGDGLLQLSKESWALDEILPIYQLLKMDLIVIEGYKTYPFPKVVLIRKEEDLQLIKNLKNIKAIISQITMKDYYPYPIFQFSEMNEFCRWLEK